MAFKELPKAALVYVEIADEPFDPGRPYTDRTTGMTKPARPKQNAYVHTDRAHPIPFKLDVDQVTGPKRPGLYVIAGGIFSPGEYDGLKFSTRDMQLMPIAEAAAELQRLAGKPSLSAAA